MRDDKGFDLWADDYDQSVGRSYEENTYPFAGYKEVLNHIYNEVMKRQEANVLDIGFGTGTLTTKLYQAGHHIFGQDFSQRMIEIAKEKMPKAKFYQGDFAKGVVDELTHQKFDYIIATYSLHHLADSDKVIFINSLLELLNPAGKILIGDVAFGTRQDLEQCRQDSLEYWDDEEFYFVAQDFKESFPELLFSPKSHCGGVLELTKKNL